MQKAESIIQAIHRMGEKRIPLTRVYRSLYSEDLFLHAYAKLYRNAGAMTPGPDEDTVDGMSRQRIRAIIEALPHERYHFRPSRRIQIPKGKGGIRQLGIPNFSDKLVQEVLRTILEAYYEPRFRNSSHGFRPGRGCHTALTTIKQRFWGTAWFIEGDIRGCFDTIDHKVLINILARDIHDGRLLNLIRQSLKAGVLDNWRHQHTYSGTPQGGVLSPLLANIYLHELDQFIEDKVIPHYTQGKVRADNPKYLNLQYKIRWARKCGNDQKVRLLEAQKWQTPSKDTHDPGYRRLRYTRYADDFLLGFVGPKKEAEAIKATIQDFLQQELHLELSPNKTLITHARTQQALFLGYAISIYQADEKRTIVTRKDGIQCKRRCTNSKVRLGVPKGLVQKLAKPYQRNNRIIGDVGLLPYSDVHIIDAFQRRFRGIAEYYKYAIDRGCLGQLQYIMEVALTKTLAEKYKISVRRVYKKYQGWQVIEGHEYKTLQVKVPTSQGERTFYWGAVPLKTIKPGTEPIEDEQPYDSRFSYSDLLQRLSANRCELCGKNTPCEVHHVRKLSDLKHRWRGRKDKPFWVKRMIALRRKTLIVCRQCHLDIHAGRPTPKSVHAILESRMNCKVQVRFGGECEETRSSNNEKVRFALTLLELGTWRVHLAGFTSHPDGHWVAQQARQLIWQFEETETHFRCLIRDNDKKYTAAFDTVFQSQQTRIVPTPLQAPIANAYSERWIRTAREEILDHILIISEGHLRRVLIEFIDYYNRRRPHQCLVQQSPIPRAEPATTGKVIRRQLLGGIINDYHRDPNITAVCLA